MDVACEHDPEDAHDEVERVIIEVVQVGGIALPECAVGQALRFGAGVPGGHQIPGDIDAQHVRPKPRRR